MTGKMALLVMLTTALLVSGCDKLTQTSQAAQSVTKHAFEDTKSSWKDFFTYHPPVPDPLPQTRYCYQMQSDEVCYDSEQPRLTAKLIGYQDGDRASWIQPGGGSLGASGGEPISLRPINTAQYNTAGDSGVIDTGPVYSSGAAAVDVARSNQIGVHSLPPVMAKDRNASVNAATK